MKAARTALDLSQTALAEAASVSRKSIVIIEGDEGSRDSLAAIAVQTHFQNCGIKFVEPTNGLGWGIFLPLQAGDVITPERPRRAGRKAASPMSDESQVDTDNHS